MTSRSTARIAGVTFLFYIAAGLIDLAVADESISGVLGALEALSALVLAGTLYSLTRVVDRDLAVLGMLCRACEGAVGASARGPVLAGFFFAVGSTLFAWLMLKGRLIPVPLAWIGVAGSALLVIALPLQLAHLIGGTATQLIWIPVAVFEVALAPWLLIKGVRPPAAAD